MIRYYDVENFTFSRFCFNSWRASLVGITVYSSFSLSLIATKIGDLMFDYITSLSLCRKGKVFESSEFGEKKFRNDLADCGKTLP